jgi:two-component system response regulator TctD
MSALGSRTGLAPAREAEIMACILLIEDSVEVKDAVFAVLSGEHQIKWAATLAEAEHEIASDTPLDLMLLDVDLPDGDGFEFLAKVDSSLKDRDIGTIFLTGTNTVDSRVRGFSLGALDYIPKPFDLTEFAVRVGAKLKSKNSLARGPFRLDLMKLEAQAKFAGKLQNLELTPPQFKLLRLLLSHFEMPVSREQILKEVWGENVHVSARAVDHAVSDLRRKIAETGSRIESVYGVGYRLDVAKESLSLKDRST